MTGQKQPAGRSVEELVALACQGDLNAYSELVYHFRDEVVGMVYRMTGDAQFAEDAAQEAFLRAWQHLSGYRPQYSFRNWVYSIAAHWTLDQLRRKQPVDTDLDDLPLASADPGPEKTLEAGEIEAQVRRAVLALPAASRAVLVLREYEGLSYAEISRALDIPLGTVMSRLNYARSQLRKTLAGVLEA